MGAMTNAFAIAHDMHVQGRTGQQKANSVTRHYGMLLNTRVKANASGRPGPNVITGNYRRSWTSRHRGMSSIVGTNAPQARRLEFGFVGIDSIGRHYHQKPYPHLGPAYAATEPEYVGALADIPSLGGE